MWCIDLLAGEKLSPHGNARRIEPIRLMRRSALRPAHSPSRSVRPTGISIAQKNWREVFEEAKADIDKVNTEIQSGIEKRIAETERNTAGGRNEERGKAVQAAAWVETDFRDSGQSDAGVTMYLQGLEMRSRPQRCRREPGSCRF